MSGLSRVKICSIIFMILLGVFASSVLAANVSDEAMRYWNRGLAAVEMAKSQPEYEAAITEFSEAARLAPDWPDVWYNLGLVQDKAGKFADAVNSLKRYLELSPNVPEASQVKQLIDKIAYKLERTSKDEAALVPLLGTWDRYDLEDGEKLNAYEFRKNGEQIEVHLFGVFGTIVVPVQFDGKKVQFKYLYKTSNYDIEYEIRATIESPGIMRGTLVSEMINAKPGFPTRPGHRGQVPTELKRR